MPSWSGIIEQYRPYLDLPESAPSVTLLEGNTPLLPMPALAAKLGAAEFHIKFEGLNPTGSFKDRGMSTAITEAVARSVEAVICASTGNTAASAAAYAARAGIRCVVLLPEGKVAAGKLAGAQAYGAQVIEIEGSFDRALEIARQLAERGALGLMNSINPYRLEGQKTAAFEICDALGTAPDWLALPVGNAGNISALWMGFQQYTEQNENFLPHLLGVQAEGAAPLVLGHEIDHPQTVATAIRIGRPARGEQALAAAEQSGGRIVAASDRSILAAQKDLARQGVWVEPASAAGLAGLQAEVRAGHIALDGKRVVCICTGHGLKDPSAPIAPSATVPAELELLEDLLDL